MTTTEGPRSLLESLRLVRAALRHQGLTDRERVVLAELASHDPSQFTPTMGVLAANLYGEDNRRTRDQCRRMIRSLEAKGVLAVRYVGKKTGMRKPRYVLTFGDVERTSPPDHVTTEDDQGDVEPTSPPAEATFRQRQVTLSQRRGDVRPQGLRAKDQDQSRTRKKGKGGDVERTSPKKNGPAANNASSAVKRLKGVEKKVFKNLRGYPDGMQAIDIAHLLGKTGSIEIRDVLDSLLDKGILTHTHARGYVITKATEAG